MLNPQDLHLNPEQLQAVNTIEGPLLIIAGAGSGKTRVVTMRIAHMLESGIPQNAILALTFTNKAAREMEHRVRDLTGKKLSNLTVSTFHAFGVHILKDTIHHLGYRENFTIYDTTDQISLIKETAREIKFHLEPAELTKLVNLFSSIKTGRSQWQGVNEHFRSLYDEYQVHLKLYNAVDFDDLIQLPVRIFEEFPEALDGYRARYRYVLVDEFQDTSKNQYRLMKLIADGSRNVCAVGDDDQSIYSWRGANYENIVQFEHDFPGVLEIKLEQNYRSTGTILAAANGVISHNTNRKHKELWTGVETGKPVELFFPENEQAEGEFVARMIKSLAQREQIRYEQIGVLMRTNSLSRTVEEAFLSMNLPYKMSGGTSFFERKEVKDLISYLRVMANPDDDVSLLRILNTPRRGIGRRSLEQIVAVAERRKESLFSAMSAVCHAAVTPLPEKNRTDLVAFLELIEKYQPLFREGKKKLASHLRELVAEIDYWGYLVQEFQKNDKVAKWKFRNIEWFAQSLEDWERDPDNVKPSLYNFLNRITLQSRDDLTEEDDRGKVNLMTIHAAKGLEFDIVFLVGVEEGIIPHARALEESELNVEEERRLFYVAITRAKVKLYLSSCRKRKVMREIIECTPSPFIEEIPPELVEIREDEDPVDSVEADDYFARIRQRFAAPR
ncbi:MAG TPA: UvrD-helicase domain-containing protein [Spirochaetia bacterium]|nr:UvrD-helicase domain-containing protein [Spirochaetia bacterium]